MPYKVTSVLAQTKLLVHLIHGGGLWVHILPGLGVLLVEIIDKDKKVPEPPLLKEPPVIIISFPTGLLHFLLRFLFQIFSAAKILSSFFLKSGYNNEHCFK